MLGMEMLHVGVGPTARRHQGSMLFMVTRSRESYDNLDKRRQEARSPAVEGRRLQTRSVSCGKQVGRDLRSSLLESRKPDRALEVSHFLNGLRRSF